MKVQSFKVHSKTD